MCQLDSTKRPNTDAPITKWITGQIAISTNLRFLLQLGLEREANVTRDKKYGASIDINVWTKLILSYKNE